MERVVIIARLSELVGLLNWVAREHYPDTPLDCPAIKDKIRERCDAILQTYFVRKASTSKTTLTAIEELLTAIEDEVGHVLGSVAQSPYQVTSVGTISFDGSTRFILTMLNGESHDRSLPETDTG